MPIPADAVSSILQQWQTERPDLDVTAMGIIGRLNRCANLVQRQLQTVFAQFELSAWEFDALATLRRSGEPYCLSPTQLFSKLMISSGTMTRQLQQLEARGLIARVANPQDARSNLVQLAPAGWEIIELAIAAHTSNLQRMLAGIEASQLAQLDASLGLFMQELEARYAHRIS